MSPKCSDATVNNQKHGYRRCLQLHYRSSAGSRSLHTFMLVQDNPFFQVTGKQLTAHHHKLIIRTVCIKATQQTFLTINPTWDIAIWRWPLFAQKCSKIEHATYKFSFWWGKKSIQKPSGYVQKQTGELQKLPCLFLQIKCTYTIETGIFLHVNSTLDSNWRPGEHVQNLT